MKNLETKIAELGRVILGGDVALCLDSEMILDRCGSKVTEAKALLTDANFNDGEARYLVADTFGIELAD
jgi:hypothetical protein